MNCMYIQVPARVLTEAQIGFDFVPADIFTDEVYQTNLKDGLHVYRQSYRILILPESDYITKETAEAVVELTGQGFPCVCINTYPQGICSDIEAEEERKLVEEVRKMADSVALSELAGYMRERNMPCIQILPEEKYIRSYQYYGNPEILYLVNEGTKIYEGSVRVQKKDGKCYRYDAWENCLEPLNMKFSSEYIEIRVCIEPGKSWIIVWDDTEIADLGEEGREFENEEKIPLIEWERSFCRSIEYPEFGEKRTVTVPDFAERDFPDFAGIVRYETSVILKTDEETDMLLEITDAGEAVQVFVNDADCGIQIVPPYRYRLKAMLHQGENRIAVEAATTLERQIPPKNPEKGWQPQNHAGLCGEVFLYREGTGEIKK